MDLINRYKTGIISEISKFSLNLDGKCVFDRSLQRGIML